MHIINYTQRTHLNEVKTTICIRDSLSRPRLFTFLDLIYYLGNTLATASLRSAMFLSISAFFSDLSFGKGKAKKLRNS
jgi:hypothetical protein